MEKGLFTDPRDFLPQDDQAADVESGDTVDQDRRRVVGALGAAVAVLAVPGAITAMRRKEEPPIQEPKRPQSAPTAPEPEVADLVEEVVQEVEGKTLEEVLREEGDVTLTEDTVAAIRAAYREKWGREGDLHQKLIDSLGRMSPWKAQIDALFEKAGVPKDLALLAIQESGFVYDANSKGVGAHGYYQFLPETATSDPVNLRVSEVIDDRQDPLRSARGCARFLQHYHDRLFKDWDLVLSAYNGTYPWRYVKELREQNEAQGTAEQPTYAGFLSYMTEQINALRKAGKQVPSDYIQNLEYAPIVRAIGDAYADLDSREWFTGREPYRYEVAGETQYREFEHEVESGQGLLQIARTYGSTLAAVMERNGIADPDKVRVGEQLIVPVVVAPNATLREVAERHEVPVERVIALNPGVLRPEAPLPDRYQVRIPTAPEQREQKIAASDQI